MKLDVLLTPRDVNAQRVRERAVVVFDVLRATTTLAAALAAGAEEIRIFDSLDAAAVAAEAHPGPRILCGERNCLPPPGFELGNSPGAFESALHAGRTVFMCTTNGTRAILAARMAKLLLTGAVVNATAVAERLAPLGMDVTLLCAGTGGEPAMEDVLGAGAVIDALFSRAGVELEGDLARMAARLFRCSRDDLRSVMADSIGGRNVLAVGLGADIEFASRLDSVPVVGGVADGPLRVMR